MSYVRKHYTLDELYNNYEFKVVKKVLMREYPWIKDVSVNPKDLDYYNIIFMNLDFDPIKLGEDKDWELSPWVKKAYDEGKYYHEMYLSLFYNKISFEDSDELKQELESLMNSVHNSPALPKDLKIEGERKFTVGDFYFNKGGEPWF